MINLLGKRLYLKTSVLGLVKLILEGVHLTLPRHIFSGPSKIWSMLHHRSVGDELRMK